MKDGGPGAAQHDNFVSSSTAQGTPVDTSDVSFAGNLEVAQPRIGGHALRSLSLPKFLSGGGSGNERISPTVVSGGGSGLRRWPFGGRSGGSNSSTPTASGNNDESPFATSSESSGANSGQRRQTGSAAAPQGRRRWSFRRHGSVNSTISSGHQFQQADADGPSSNQQQGITHPPPLSSDST
jgi:hypothetical protein